MIHWKLGECPSIQLLENFGLGNHTFFILIYIRDVGDQTWEEINIISAGKNYGWRVLEGSSCYDPDHLNITSCDGSLYEPPIFQYDHISIVDLCIYFNLPAGICVVGGRVYRGTEVPELYGKYIFADYAYGEFWSLPITPPYQSTLLLTSPYRYFSKIFQYQSEKTF